MRDTERRRETGDGRRETGDGDGRRGDGDGRVTGDGRRETEREADASVVAVGEGLSELGVGPGEAELTEALGDDAAAVEQVFGELAHGGVEGEAGDGEPARAADRLAERGGELDVADRAGDQG